MMLYEKDYRRHSALRTINGGMCWGLSLRRVGLAQLLLLGYQRIVNNSIFKGNLIFFNFSNIAILFFEPLRIKMGRLPHSKFTLLLSTNLGSNFWELSKTKAHN